MPPLNSLRVSILTPVFNSAPFLRATVASVLAQSHLNWELLLIIDPASTDSSADLAHSLAREDRRIRVLTAKEPGVTVARNLGLNDAEGRMVAFLDSDDLWLSVKLERQLRFMRTLDASFSCTAFRRINDAGTRVGRRISVPMQISYSRLLQQNCILCSSVMLDRERISSLEFAAVGCEDFALWLKLLRSGHSCFGIRQDLVRYRLVRGSRGAGKWRSLRETWEIYRNLEKLSAMRAAWTMFPFVIRGLEKHAWF